jgi:brefeldin A-inhibited guanine nucleotide-exchange protein
MVFDKLSQNSMMLLEIFINYDCDVAQQDISKQIVEALSKIANGKLTKSEHKSMISSQEELVLRSYAIQILVQMLRSFNGTIDAEIAESKVTERIKRSK